MKILGVDPALTVTGYGVIEFKKGRIGLVEAGVIKTTVKQDLAGRLERIYRATEKLISDTHPDVMVLEKIYSHYRHPATAFHLGQARGVIYLAGALAEIPVVEYGATRIKKAIVGRGLASKQQVQKMVAHSIGLEKLPAYTDVTDALALAIAHGYITRV
ncbi:MAG: crossover junction endodeoxyribonuclease RuvC [Candidatus Omnitrophica bacterium]|nr:crossover junction endodeoxyribonuclease RuvC [Candidatus Omnitrophota bacterium]MDD5512698.1 crossover junction endodeoxyribonuclease RuvC [Candidatus Omnitrophota bacterium]